MATASPRCRPGSASVASSEGAPFAVIADDARQFYGTMFHPEVVHTPHGAALLSNFTHGVCGCTGDWTMGAIRAETDRQDPRPGRHGPGGVRPVRRRRFIGGGGADP